MAWLHGGRRRGGKHRSHALLPAPPAGPTRHAEEPADSAPRRKGISCERTFRAVSDPKQLHETVRPCCVCVGGWVWVCTCVCATLANDYNVGTTLSGSAALQINPTIIAR